MLGKQLQPPIVAVGPRVEHRLVTRTAIDVNQHRIFLRGVEVGRQNLPSVDVDLLTIGQSEGGIADLHEFLLTEIKGLQLLGKLVVVLKHTHQLALVRVKLVLRRLGNGRVDINKVAEVVAEAGVVGARATNHLAHLTLQVDGIDLTVDGGVLGGLEIDFLAVEAVNGGHVPRAVGELLHHCAVHIIKVDVVVAAAFRGHQKAFAVLKEVPVVGDVDVVFVGLVIKHAALARGGIGGQNLQVVLVTVEALDGQHVGVLRPGDAGQVDVGLGARVHLHGLAACEVVDVNADDGVVLARLGVLEAVPIGIEAFKLLHLELAHVALVKLHESDLLAVGRPVKALREAELFFINPVRSTIDNVIIEAVVSELFLLPCRQVLDEEVVVAHESHFGGIGRESSQTLLAVLRKRLQGLGVEVVDIIIRVERMAVDALHIGEAQHLVLVLAQLVVLQSDGQRIGMHGEVADAKQGLFQFA